MLSNNSSHKITIALIVYLLLATGKLTPISEDSIESFVGFFLFSIFFLLIVLYFKSTKELGVIFRIILIYFCWLIFSMLRSDDFFFAFSKIEGAIFISIASSTLVALFIKKWGESDFIESFINVAALILVATVFYRYSLNLNGREGRFFLNGPIVFGWLMGFVFLMSLLFFYKSEEKKFVFLSIVFLFAVFWSQSKGPLVASIITSTLFIVYFGKRSPVKAIAAPFFIIIALYGIAYHFASEDFFERFYAIQRLLNNEVAEVDAGSVTIRSDMWGDSINLWTEFPLFGSGLGGWATYIDDYLKYPHNFLLESLSETGLIGFIFLILTIIFCFIKSNIYGRASIIYFALCLSFSGDASYLRFIFFYPLACIGSKNLVNKF